MDDIILKNSKILSTKEESKGKIDSEINENNLYEIDNMSLDENKEKKKFRKHAFERKI